MGSHRVGHVWSNLACMHALVKRCFKKLLFSLENNLMYLFFKFYKDFKTSIWINKLSLLELDTNERLPFHFSLSCIGEGNGNPRQCSCLENPRDGGAWWAAVYGVTQSQTRLKWLSSSSSNIRHTGCRWVHCHCELQLHAVKGESVPPRKQTYLIEICHSHCQIITF